MPLRVLASLTAPGSASKANEDVVGCNEHAAWVLDGATGLGERRLLPGESDAAWLVGKYSELLARQADGSGPPTEELVRRLILRMAEMFAAEADRGGGASGAGKAPEKHEMPSAGMALARATSGGLDLASLGDCRAIVELSGGGVLSVCDTRLGALDSKAIDRMQALLDNGEAETPEEARAAVQPLLQANRALMNTPHGYWVLSIHPEAAGGMEVRSLSLGRGAKVRGLLVTDGFYRLVDPFTECRDDADLLGQAFAPEPRSALKRLLGRLRAIEDADPRCANHQRLKGKDDASALAFEATAG